MHVVAISAHHVARHIELLREMYRLRYRVFRDRLNWDVSASGKLELDLFDTLGPDYLIALDQGQVVGCVRLLPTTGPTMLAETFPALLGDRQAPRSERILESSRFCVDTRSGSARATNGVGRVTFVLFAAMIEYLDAAGADAIVTVTDVRMERILRRAGWPLDRISPPQRIGETIALAGFLHRATETRLAMYERAGIEGPVLSEPALPRDLGTITLSFRDGSHGP
ncbi:acyl-homoserine-lactone synthase [Bradyrhizobium elkanii]|uniref:acyl-homoserine-lactone synthase n=1 Tax=Bradyrhizobium sp. BRP56 TaxID=2793819 RepID=UPI001CD77BCF|nr:acyl-homoserine-lactone synthase [Bradyrhizobium sp. BRP56]MCA1399518.1 GNAT family N-acetyltransferase [Bradyrhizobium sp. BRP56]